MAMTSADVVVVGAGAVGSACAYELARTGLSVKLVEREGVAAGASTHATGSFSVLSPDFYDESYLRLGISARELVWGEIEELEARSGIKTGFGRYPSFRIAIDEEEERLLRELEPWRMALTPWEWVDPAEVLKLEPRLNPALRAAVAEPEGGRFECARYTLALATAAERQGVELLLRQVTGLELAGGRVSGVRFAEGGISAERVVIALGPWASAAEAWLGFPVPVDLLRGERLIVALDGPPLAAMFNSPKSGHFIARQDGTITIGSTVGRRFDGLSEPAEAVPDQERYLPKPSAEALEKIMARALRVIPAMEEARLVDHLAGYRPVAPDRRPIIGPVPGVEGAYVAVGHGTRGIHLAQATGKLIASDITGRDHGLGIDPTPFRPARFLGGVPEERRIGAMSGVSED
jgi:glycine/D-amino acid oxidase-like deaminating enzyme